MSENKPFSMSPMTEIRAHKLNHSRIIHIHYEELIGAYVTELTKPFTWWQFKVYKNIDPKLMAELELLEVHQRIDPVGFACVVYHPSFDPIQPGERTPFLFNHTAQVETITVNFDRKDTERLNWLQKCLHSNPPRVNWIINHGDYTQIDPRASEGQFLCGIRELVDIEMGTTPQHDEVSRLMTENKALKDQVVTLLARLEETGMQECDGCHKMFPAVELRDYSNHAYSQDEVSQLCGECHSNAIMEE